MTIRSKIVGTGMGVPEHVVTNHDLEKLMDTSDEWIRQRSGIAERRHIREGERPSELAERASRRALDAAGLEPGDLDGIVLATLSSEHDFPGTSFFLHRRLGVPEIPCFDLRAQCSGFLYALATADAYIRAGMMRRVLVVGCEVHSTGLDLTTRGRNVSVLFGDGAGAVIVEANPDPEDRAGVLAVRMHAQGEHAERLWIEAPGSGSYPLRITAEQVAAGRHFPQMEGRFVFKHAVTRMPEVLRETLDAAGVKQDDVSWFLLHQANLRINEFVAQAMGIPPEKCPSNIERFGNCSAASIPMLLDEGARAGRLEPGQLIALAAFGSGFTWASAILRW
ncbi:ketoacyl-ACP synthase III [Myxococcota bacterium]|nr:ketoacyl-ACP synthase III [Myxococcota bacterium]MCZ7617902.1 ketoacyl-ACP synthase III [Myxococcota bacterium]